MLRSGVRLEIDLTLRKLFIFSSTTLKGSFPIAIGKPSTPSPVGDWSIINKSLMDGNKVYGTRWLGLSKPRYGIHGTNNPSSIGKAVSLGCIRMFNHDVEYIFPLVSIGTPVKIYKKSAQEYAVSPGLKTYVVQRGDTLWEISQRLGISLQHLLGVNPQVRPESIFPGQVISY